MHLRNLVAVAQMLLHFSVGSHEQTTVATTVEGPVPSVDLRSDNTSVHAPKHKKVLVKYDTIIHSGALVFSKPGVDTYSAVITDKLHETAGIYLAARDWMVKLDLFFNEIEAIAIPPSSNDTMKCEESFPADECHNFIKYIKPVHKYAVEKIFACGTFAHSPACSVRLGNKLSIELQKIDGSFAPGNPCTDMATYLSEDQLFVGLVDSRDNKTKIQNTKLAEDAKVFSTVENKGWLNEAVIVGAFSPSIEDKFVYFVFREIATEAPVDNVTYSRVARICKDDEGQEYAETKGREPAFGSFLKAHLDCGEYNQVQAISYTENDPYFWATFTSDFQNGSAICGFFISDTEHVFRGPYLYHDNETNKWEQCPPPYIQKGDEMIATCFGFRLKEAVVNYVLMSEKIPHNCSAPSFIADAIFNKIAVISGKEDNFTAFVGDELGRVWKIELMNCDYAEEVELWEVIPQDEQSREINALAIHNGSIIVLTHKTAVYVAAQDYPGEIIADPTTGAPPTSVSYSPSLTTRSPSNITEGPSPNSHPRIKFPSSFPNAALILISTTLISF